MMATTPAKTTSLAQAKQDDLPTTCSLWSAFDKMQLCYTLLPQSRYYYKYGTLKDCTAAREEFFFCARMKSKPRAVAAQLIQEREEAKRIKKIVHRPSQGVWEIREAPAEDFPPSGSDPVPSLL
ncbi:hypothetical protein BJ742DRAFT_808241 [Cladochytrium replicatum]|nr:hypothetical protein BJ742DRAFT_808241 [Cladochytrium replicatum]